MAKELPAWSLTGKTIMLWHGCLQSNAKQIIKSGVDLKYCRHATDFGRGFYTTTNEKQAVDWARLKWLNIKNRTQDKPSVLTFEIPRSQLAYLHTLVFVRTGMNNAAYWSFVHHCRNSKSDDTRTHLFDKDRYYDLICGPVAISWPPREKITLPDSDQFSFHSTTSLEILNRAISSKAYSLITLKTEGV